MRSRTKNNRLVPHLSRLKYTLVKYKYVILALLQLDPGAGKVKLNSFPAHYLISFSPHKQELLLLFPHSPKPLHPNSRQCARIPCVARP